MTSILILRPEEDMIERISSLLYKEGRDYSKSLVVFPGKRPAHYLRRSIARKESSSFIPPLILSIDEFTGYISKKVSPSLKDIERIDAIAILYRLCKNNPSLNETFRAFDSFYPFGGRLLKVLEELYIEGISVERLRSVETLIEIPEKSKDNMRFLSAIYEGFYNELLSKGLSTRSMIYRICAEKEGISEYLISYKSIIFAGFFALTNSEKVIFRRLIKDFEKEDNSTLYLIFHDGEGIEDTLSGIRGEVRVGLSKEGLLIPGEGGDVCYNSRRGISGEVIPKPFIYSAPDIHGEVYLAGNLISRLEEFDEETVVVLPQPETLFPFLRHGIPHLEEDKYNISMGYPITRTPIYGFFLNLFKVLSSTVTSPPMKDELVYMQDYLRFMLHPYTKNIHFRWWRSNRGSAEENRIILHEIEDLYKKGKLPHFMTLKEIEDIFSDGGEVTVRIGSEVFEGARDQLAFIHENTIRRFLSIEDIGDFVKKCCDLILFIYRESTAKLHPLFFPYMEVFLKELQKVSNSEMGGFSFEERESYFNLFKSLVSSLTVPFEGTPLRGLQILGFLETRNIRFKRIFFLDLNEGVFPDLSEDYILPYQVRKTLGLSTYQERERLLYYYFDNLIRGAEEVHLFYIKSEDLEESRFLKKLRWSFEKSEGRGAIREKTVNYQADLSTSLPSGIEKTEEILNVIKTLSFTASSLDEYLECGLRFYYNNILSLRKGAELTSHLERAEIGEIVHRALSLYFTNRINRIFTEDEVSHEEMEEILNRLFKERYGNVSGRLYLIRHQVIRRLKEFLDYAKRTQDLLGKEIAAVEEVVEGNLFDAFIKGRIDLLIKDGRRFIIVDFKTSSKNDNLKIDLRRYNPSDRSTWREAVRSLQIPLYMRLYSEVHGIDMADMDGYYILLGSGKLDEKSLYRPIDQDNRDKLELLFDMIERVIDEIRDPEIPFSPPDIKALRDHCPLCDYATVCGTTWVKRREYVY